ncbi:MAG: ATP-binding domain-containing protein, partial [Alphaproteobacteria bacterium]|nr:ATP-binding domain-containing protein [Alphaproteobacteria bacterium]
AGFQTREFEERFIQMGLAYRVVGGPRFYERQEIRDALAYLRLVHQPADDFAFERVVNTPRRGIGTQTLQALHHLARSERISLSDAAARLIATDELKPAARKALGGFLTDVARWRGLVPSMPHTELVQIVLDESGYTAMWQADKSPDAPGRLENLKELVGALDEFENLGGFLDHVSLVMENAEQSGGDMVSLMTLHGAKGLEFDVVFLPGWEEGLFPNQRSLDEHGMKGLEEERRLAYVGLTRARRRAYVAYAANRRIHGQWQTTLPSRFIADLPQDHTEMNAEPGLQPRAAGFTPAGLDEDWQPTPLLRRRPELARLLMQGRRDIPPPPPKTGVKFAAGDRVFHRKFGLGTVRAADGGKLSIAFDQAGDKMVMDSFVEKA